MGNTEGVPAEVRRMQEQFERWRAGKQPRERIPQRLWEAAARLCKTNSIHRVSRWLRLNHTSLQGRARRRTTPRRSNPAFVEWSLPAGAVPGNSSAQYVVEVAGDGAQRIHARGVSISDVAALSRALRADESGG